jgi:drug/metabolite transporter (DMT)-like permease
MKKSRNAGVESSALIASTFFFAAVFVTPWALLTSDDLGGLHGSDWLLIITMVLVPGLLGHGLMTWAQRYLDITTASLLILGQAPLSTLGAYWLYDEGLTVWQLIGSVIVLGGLTGVVLQARTARVEPATTLSVAME